MVPGGGGRAAARGFRYQYLRTLDEMLDLLEQDSDVGTRVQVEGPPVAPDSSQDGEIVDYAVRTSDGAVIKIAQVRSVDDHATSRAMSAPAVFSTLLRLVGAGDSASYELQTNARLTSGAERLAAILEDGTARDLRSAIVTVLDGTSAQADAAMLSDEQLRRLRSARVQTDRRSPSELRQQLRQRLRRYRGQMRDGVGYEAAGLLTGYLLDQIFGAAADPVAAELSLGEFRSLLMTQPMVLAQAIGRRWGTSLGKVPWLPEIERVEMHEEVRAGLDPTRLPTTVRRAAIHGPSGLGKTSLAASYAFACSDVYDFVFWIDAETADSIRISFSEVLAATEGEHGLQADAVAGPLAAPITDERLRSRVHHLLAEYPGVWLVVFDGALDERVIARWVPPAGRGHVLVTTTNSAGWTEYRRVEAKPMLLAEARSLLALRLQTSPDEPALAQLAEAVHCWPLALEIAAGYLTSCGLSAAAIPRYLDGLRAKALDDNLSVPASYARNRTLVAALTLCLERLESQANAEDMLDPVRLAVAMLGVASYLGSRRIPADLLLASVLFSPEDKARMSRGPVEIDGFPVSIEQLVRLLRSESLVTIDRGSSLDLAHDATPIHGRPPTGLRLTVSTYEVVQDVVRALVADNEPDPTAYVLSAVYAVQDWLAAYRDADQFDGIDTMVPHAQAAILHARDLGVRSPHVALLLGNLANVRIEAGRLNDASELLEQELDMLADLGLSGTVIDVKTRQALANTLSNTGAPPNEVIDHVEACVASLDALGTRSRGLVNEIANLFVTLQSVASRDVEDARLPGLASRLAAKLADTTGTGLGRDDLSVQSMLELNRLDLELDGDERAVAADARRMLDERRLAPTFRLKVQAILVEALCWMGDWDAANEALEEFARLLAASPLGVGGSIANILNGASSAFEAAVKAVHAGAPNERRYAPIRYLRRSLGVVGPIASSPGFPAFDRARFWLLTAALAMADGDVLAARDALAEVDARDFQRGPTTKNDVYETLLDSVAAWVRMKEDAA